MDEECWKEKYSIDRERVYYVNKESGYSQWGISKTFTNRLGTA